MDLVGIASSSIRRRKGRSLFLMSGILVGVAAVVALLSLADSLSREAGATMETFGANIVVVPASKEVGLSYGGMSVGGVSVGGEPLGRAHLERISSIPARDSLEFVAPGLLGNVRVGERTLPLSGIVPEAEFALKRWWSVDTGRPPYAAAEAVVGSAAAKALGVQMGDYLDVEGTRVMLTGVLAETGSEDDHLLVVPLATAQDILDAPGRLSHVQLAASYTDVPLEEIVGQLEAALPGARVLTVREVVEGRLYAVDQFKTFSYGIAIVVVLIGALVVFITMMGSVSERTREIGVLRAIGFRRGQVAQLILAEASVACSVGAVAGYALGIGITYALLPTVAEQAQVTWTPLPAAAAVGVAALTGGLAALYPALHAARVEPSEALRAL